MYVIPSFCFRSLGYTMNASPSFFPYFFMKRSRDEWEMCLEDFTSMGQVFPFADMRKSISSAFSQETFPPSSILLFGL